MFVWMVMPAQADVTTGLFSRYTFEVDARDDVGSNDGTLVNGAAVYADPQRGNVLSLDGSDDHISLPRSSMAAGRSELTVAMWIKPDEWVSGNAIYDEYGGNYGEYWQFTVTEGKWYTRDGSTGSMGLRDNDLSLPSVPVGQWHHLAFVYSVSGDLKAIYYDGSPYTSSYDSVDTLTTDRDGAALGKPCDGSYYDGLVDDLRFYSRALSPAEIADIAAEDTYVLTVHNGTGEGDYIVGAIVPISADTPLPGEGFAAWVGDVGGIDDPYSPSTTVIMPDSDVEITAAYGALYTLTVHTGSGSGQYPAGGLAEISADAPLMGKAFGQWAGEVGGIDDIYDPFTTLVMPTFNATVTATYITASGEYLTVNKGTGDGTYLPDTVVPVTADTPVSGQEFYLWVGDVSYVADVNTPSTTVTMPDAAVKITASYRDAGATLYEVHQDLDEVTGRIYRLDDKPYLDLIDANGLFQTETLIFHDTETGKEVWSLTRELCTDLANIERRTAWSRNGQYISFVSSKNFWDYRTNSMWTGAWGGYTHIANSDTSRRRKLWAYGPSGIATYQDKFNNWNADVPNLLYYGMGDNVWQITLGPGNNDTENTAEAVCTFPSGTGGIIQEVHDDNWLLVEGAGSSPYCHLVNLRKDPSDPHFVISYPLAGEVHPGSFRFRRSLWVCTGGYEYISGGITLYFNETSCWPGTLNTHLTSGVSTGHLWYGPPDDRRGFFGSYLGNGALWLQHPGQWPVLMADVPDGHVTWCSMDPEWFFAAVGPGTCPDIQYERRLLACNADGQTVEIICRPWDRSRGTDGGYDKYPRPNQSPDATKCWFHADMLNPSNYYTGSYIAVFRKPYAPTSLQYIGGQIVMTPHTLAREVESYLVYRQSGPDWQVVAEVSAETAAWPVDSDGTYMVTALEWSGIESDTSSRTITVPGGSVGSAITGWDTTAPAKLTNLTVTPEGVGRYRLAWDASTDADLRYYNLYSWSASNPPAIQQRRFASPPKNVTEYLDWTAPLTGDVYYAVTAVDRQGNESQPAYLNDGNYVLTVSNGTGSGAYPQGAIVSVSADPAPSGKAFAIWTGDVSYLADQSQADTTLTMPDGEVSITAAYTWAYELTVNSGSGSGWYPMSTIVDIQADPAPTGSPFEQWAGDVVHVADVYSPGTTFTMPNYACQVTATYETALVGDLDGNGNVGQGDLDIILDAWGSNPASDPLADANGDGWVGQPDLDIILENWGESL